MKVRIIARFKNEHFFKARIEANLTQGQLADLVGVSLITIFTYENFGGYPVAPDDESGKGKRYSWIAKNIEKLFKIPYETLFPEEYRMAVDKKLGKPIHVIHEFLELPEAYVERNLILPDPADIYEMTDLKERIKEKLKFLTEREAEVLKMRYGLEGYDEHITVEVAREMKLSHERIRQIEDKALRKLKRHSWR